MKEKYKIGLCILSAFLFWMQSYQASSQSVLWSASNKLIKRSNFRHIIGKNNSGIYILKFKSYSLRKRVHVEKYSHNLKLIKSYNLKIGSGRLESVLLKNSGLTFFVSEGRFNAQNKILKIYKINAALTKAAKSIQLFESTRFNFTKEKLSIRKNKVTQQIGIVYEEKSSNGNAVICFDLRDSNLNVISQKKFELDRKSKEIEIHKHFVNSDGNFFILLDHIELDAKRASSFRKSMNLYWFKSTDKTMKNYEIENSSLFYQGVKIVSNPKSNKLFIAGFYSYESLQNQEGILVYTIDKFKGNFLDTNYILFSKPTVIDITGFEKNKKDDILSHFNMDKLIVRSDGGLIITAERHFISKDVETYFINGMPHDVAKKIYNFDEFVIFSIDSMLNYQWHKVMRKHQSTVNDGGYYSSVSTVILPNKIHFLYNDALKENGTLVQMSLSNNAILTRKELFANAGSKVMIFPSEASQISYNSILIPAFKNRDVSLLKLTYKP